MELSDKHIEAIKAAARGIDYGSITINIVETLDYIEIVVRNRVRIILSEASGRKPPE